MPDLESNQSKEDDTEVKCMAARFISDRIKDALWHYGIDSYKRPALSLGVLLYEFKYLMGEFYQEAVPASTIDPVFEELIHSLDKDSIFPHVNDYVSNNHIKEIKSYINQKFSGMKKDARHEIEKRVDNIFDNYIAFVLDSTKEIVQKFMNDGKEKILVNDCIGNWLTEVISTGISHEGLYSLALLRLNEDKDKITPEKVVSFISDINSIVISSDLKEYEVIIRVTSSPAKFLDAQISALNDERVSLFNPTKKNKFYEKSDGARWIKFRINAKEKHTAKEKAIQQCKNIISLIVFESHKFSSEIYKFIEVKEGDGTPELLKDKLSVLRRREDGSVSDIKKLAASVINIQKDPRTQEDILPLLNGFKSHTIAVRSQDVQNQLLTIWSAFEAFIPYPRTDSSRLQYFLNYLAPIVSSNYPAHLILRTLKSISAKFPPVLDEIKKASPADSENESILKFASMYLMNAEHEVHQSILYFMSESPLDMFKYWGLNNRFSTANFTLDEVQRHETKIRWQLARIYRLRNSIAHQGQSFFTVPMITEHAHGYLDKIIRLLVACMEDDPLIASPFDAILVLRDDHNSHVQRLKEASRTSKPEDKLPPEEYLFSGNYYQWFS